MAINSGSSLPARPCSRSHCPPCPRWRDQSDIKVASHKLTIQHSIRAQKLGQRQLTKVFKTLDDLKLKRLLQIGKEMGEQEEVLTKLEYDRREMLKEQLAAGCRGGGSVTSFSERDLSDLVLPDQFRGGHRSSLRRTSSFDLYAFMMRRESERAIIAGDRSKRRGRNGKSPPLRQAGTNGPKSRLNSPELDSARSPISSMSIISEPSTLSGIAFPAADNFGEIISARTAGARRGVCSTGSDWSDYGNDVNKGMPTRAPRQQRTQDSKQQQQHRASVTFSSATGQGDTFRFRGRTARSRPPQKLKKEVSFRFETQDEDESECGDTKLINEATLALVIMNKLRIAEAGASSPTSTDHKNKCNEPDCIFHNKTYHKADNPCDDDEDDDFTIDDYYRTVGEKSTVSPLFMPAGSSRSWNRRQAVRPPSPNPSDFLREFDSPVSPDCQENVAETDRFLTVRRPLKGSNHDRMLKEKVDNVRTTFRIMRKKMADQRPHDFNQNYGTPTPNWKILDPLKLRHKINQSNPLHIKWGL